MKMYCIADKAETEVGFKLAGCDGISLVDKDEIDEKIEEIIKNTEIGVLIITNTVYNIAKEKIDYIRLNKRLPLVTII